jgi:hypothetical protein
MPLTIGHARAMATPQICGAGLVIGLMIGQPPATGS